MASMSSRSARVAWTAIRLLVAGVGLSTLHAHPIDEPAEHATCSACVLVDCQAPTVLDVEPIDPPDARETVALAPSGPFAKVSVSGPPPTRGLLLAVEQRELAEVAARRHHLDALALRRVGGVGDLAVALACARLGKSRRRTRCTEHKPLPAKGGRGRGLAVG